MGILGNIVNIYFQYRCPFMFVYPMNRENQQFLKNEPSNVDQKPGIKGGNWMGIRLTTGGSWISTSLHFEIIHNCQVK